MSPASDMSRPLRVDARICRFADAAADDAARDLARRFHLPRVVREHLWRRFELVLRPGRIIAVTGPSGSGKSVLLREVLRARPEAVRLTPHPREGAGSVAGRVPPDQREAWLSLLSRCGLGDARVLASPVARLSGGERHRLALAEAIRRAERARAGLIVADEFCTPLDEHTAAALCFRLRRLARRRGLCLLVATPRRDVIDALRPDRIVRKPLDGAPELLRPPRTVEPFAWPVERGRIGDFRALQRFHYLPKPPAAHKRVYVVRPPQNVRAHGWVADPAATLVVSPPVLNCAGRSAATGGRYTGPDRRCGTALLNAEIECISRVVVHPLFRGCALARRLVGRALLEAETPLVECLASMGHYHAFLRLAGMSEIGVFRGAREYVYYLAVRQPV